MENCIFCKIIRKEIPADIVYEDEHVLAFLDIYPRAPGHTVVIPKMHAPDLGSLDETLVGPLFGAVKRVAAKVSRALLPDGITYGINQGRASGQEVDHLHIHIMPRYHGDGGGSIQSAVNNPPQKDLIEIADAIRSATL